MKQITRKLQRLMGFSALALTLVLGACADGAEHSLLGPRSAGPSESLSLSDDLAALAEGTTPNWTEDRTNWRVIGPSGGHVYLDLHYLYVPPGAVEQPTKFEVTLRQDHKIGVALTATSSDRAGRLKGDLNDVGSAGFKKPVYLTFSYKFAADKPADPSSIRVVEVLNGQLIPQPTYVNTAREFATGALKHFSDYGLAWPGRTGG